MKTLLLALIIMCISCERPNKPFEIYGPSTKYMYVTNITETIETNMGTVATNFETNVLKVWDNWR